MGCTLSQQTTPLAATIVCTSLFLGSFGDEAAQVAFALRLANGNQTAPTQVSALLAAGLVGGLLAGLIAPHAIVLLGARRVIDTVFITEAALIAAASLANTLFWCLAVAATLGCLGSILWAAVMVALPALNTDETGVDRANRIVQSMRNLGYVVGPLVGSALFAWSSGIRGLLTLAALMIFSAVCVTISLPLLVDVGVGKESGYDGRRAADIRGLLQTKGICRAVIPLLITVLVTSTLNVLLIVRVRNELSFSAEMYGVIVAVLSAGLVAGPILFAGLAGKLGEAAGASVGAAVIGLGITVVGAAQFIWQLVAAAACIGIANGVQNTLMSGFMIKTIDPAKRAFQMPAYFLILQTTVFAGFVGAAFIRVEQAGITLVVVGVLATLVGTFGAFLNRLSKQQPLKEGKR